MFLFWFWVVIISDRIWLRPVCPIVYSDLELCSFCNSLSNSGIANMYPHTRFRGAGTQTQASCGLGGTPPSGFSQSTCLAFHLIIVAQWPKIIKYICLSESFLFTGPQGRGEILFFLEYSRDLWEAQLALVLNLLNEETFLAPIPICSSFHFIRILTRIQVSFTFELRARSARPSTVCLRKINGNNYTLHFHWQHGPAWPSVGMCVHMHNIKRHNLQKNTFYYL